MPFIITVPPESESKQLDPGLSSRPMVEVEPHAEKLPESITVPLTNSYGSIIGGES